MPRKPVYPPEPGPDPFEAKPRPRAPLYHPKMARAILGRFMAGEDIIDLAWDYGMAREIIEHVLRWAVARAATRRSIR